MKILITGANGQLGTELRRCLESGKTELGELDTRLQRATVLCTDVDTLDITKRSEVASYVRHHAPDVIISCAAYTNVDGCETNIDDAFRVNALGARNLALAAQETEAKLLHVSTDYVFSGEASAPVSEFELPAPQSVYGKTKLLGEQYVQQFCKRHFIVRTAWLYGYVGKNFVKTIRSAAIKNGAVRVVNDQFGNPTNAADLAHHILRLICTKEYGIYHCTGEGVCSWYDFTCEILRLAGVQATVTPCASADYPSPTKRPAYSALENRMLAATIGNKMRDWKVALASFFENYQPED